ncbi:MAG: GldG family protein [Acidobacteria bacterium]|nr:GldG family protein [Acidobacteriota bacterium]
MNSRHLLLSAAASVLALALVAPAQQVADPNFDTKVAKPAYAKGGPRVLFDEAHHNFHTASGRYKPFADLITADGYRVTPNTQKFTRELLKGYDILVISNALGAAKMGTPEASNPAFTEAECDAVRDWVRSGGALLLIADHAPMGAANANLGSRFGVEMSKGHTIDPANTTPEGDRPGLIVYTRERGLGDHAITNGRDAGERVGLVIAFSGQSLKGPSDAVAFMRLSDTARDVTRNAARESEQDTSAAGRAQGLAMKTGKGRVVVMAEAAMLSAQLMGPNKAFFGMNRPGTDNRRLALNILHWLSRKI